MAVGEISSAEAVVEKGLPLELRREEGEWDYVAVVETMDALLGRQGQNVSKGLFGGYNDPLLYKWHSLQTTWEKNWCHLAESAEIILQNVKYEIPNQRKQVERIQKQLLDLEKREALLTEEAASFAKQYERSCAQLGISGSGENITAELEALVHRLPQFFDEIVAAVKVAHVRRAADFYALFCGYTEAMAASATSWKPKAVCTSLAFVLAHGNASRLDLERHLAPEKWADITTIVEVQQNHHQQPALAVVEVDWSAATTGADDNLDTADWNIEAVDDGEVVAAESSISNVVEPIVIDYVEMEMEPTAGTTCAATATKDDLAKRYAKETILGSQESRNRFVDDLHELLAFLQGRLREKIGASSAVNAVADVITANSECPDLVRTSDSVEMLQTLRDAVQNALKVCEQPAFVQLLDIQASKRYVSRLAASVRKKMEMSEQLLNQVKQVKEKRKELHTELERVRPRLKALGARAVKTQRIIEGKLSEHFKGRTVQITGDINNIAL